MRPPRSGLRQRLTAGAAAIGALGIATGCLGGADLEDFCDAARASRDAGPLFPDRTDGEPVADPAALDALEEMADTAPGEVDTEVQTLLAEGRALVAQAAARTDTDGTAATDDAGPAPADRPSRGAVEAAQAAVAGFVAERCDVPLES